jgi:hypothetical protein
LGRSLYALRIDISEYGDFWTILLAMGGPSISLRGAHRELDEGLRANGFRDWRRCLESTGFSHCLTPASAHCVALQSRWIPAFAHCCP